jgi:two-component system, NtrC family, sensor kinase
MHQGAKPTKAKVEAKPPVARKSPKSDGAKLRDLEKRLAEALEREAAAQEQQAATAEILRVISNSPTDLQPVLGAVAQNASRLCGTDNVSLYRVEGSLMRKVAEHGPPLTALRVGETRPIARTTVSGRAIIDRTTIHLPDHQAATLEYPDARRDTGIRTTIGIPLLRKGIAIGVFTAYRTESRPFTEREIALLQTFADQAVIAIENVRLFKELEARNRDLTTALEQQTATGEILGVISTSPTDVQPVFEAIVQSAARLLDGHSANVLRVTANELQLAALTTVSEAADAESRATFPVPLTEAGVATHVIRTSRPYVVADIETDPLVTTRLRYTATLRGFRSMLMMPMVHHEQVIGIIGVTRRLPGAFREDEIALLQTFADQAVIAIENVRLFTELHEKNRALTQAHAQVTETLEQQTATGEILRIIAGSPADLQPVLNALVESAGRLCEAADTFLLLAEGDQLRVTALHPFVEGGAISNPIHRDWVAGRAVLEGRTVHLEDLANAQGEFPLGREIAVRLGHRTVLATPLVCKGVPIGALFLRRRQVRPFSEKEIALVQTFADQAVIAIENVRLFKELQEKNGALTEALEQQTATSDILQTIAQAQTDVQPVFETIVRSAAQLCHAHTTSVFLTDGQTLYLPANYGISPEAIAAIQARFPRPLDRGTVSGTAILNRSVMHVPDVEEPSAVEFARQTGRVGGFRSLLAVPMLRQGEAVGAVSVSRREPGPFSDAEVALLQTFADQAVIAIENVRLFKELDGANRELSAASQHKSEFLANMSHELRTPLNAIIGFSEVLTERMFGELNEKQEEYLKDIYASGTHLLSLINDILDLSKIEAGRMELELTDFHLPQAIENALILIRERAGRRGITLERSVDERLSEIRGDERKVKQVLLNLLSNALKFTPEGGRVEVRAGMVDGMAEISVTDTGVGIAPEDQGTIFEEFRQVGTADKKAEGTGLGLTLCRKFIELHGGRIWVKSQVGAGSTFTFTIPVRAGA